MSVAARRRLIDDAEAVRGHDDMGGEAAVDVVARHFLVRADRCLAAQASVAVAARDDCRDDDGSVRIPKFVRAGFDDVATDLMPERQRQFMLGAHAVVVVAKIGMADPAPGDFDYDLVGSGVAISNSIGTRGLPAPVIIQRTGLALIRLPSRLVAVPVGGGHRVVAFLVTDREGALIKVKERQKNAF